MVAIIALSGLALTVAISFLAGEPLSRLTADPLAVAGGELPYLGFMTRVGILLWALAVGFCLAGAFIHSGRNGADDSRRFFYSAAAVTTLFMLDDLFEIHEWVGYYVIPEIAVIAIYWAVLAWFLIAWRRILLLLPYWYLLLALCAFGVSVVLDAFEYLYPSVLAPTEDIFKYVGISLWAMFFASALIAFSAPPRRGDSAP